MARPTGAKAHTQCKNFFISAFAPSRGATPITHLPRAPFLRNLPWAMCSLPPWVARSALCSFLKNGDVPPKVARGCFANFYTRKITILSPTFHPLNPLYKKTKPITGKTISNLNEIKWEIIARKLLIVFTQKDTLFSVPYKPQFLTHTPQEFSPFSFLLSHFKNHVPPQSKNLPAQSAQI